MSNITKEEALKLLCNYAHSQLQDGKLLRHKDNKRYTIDELYNIVQQALQPISNDEVKEAMRLLDNIESHLPKELHYKINIIRNNFTSHISQLESKVDKIEEAMNLRGKMPDDDYILNSIEIIMKASDK